MLRPIGKEIAIRSIKVFDMGYATGMYFLFAIVSVLTLNKVYGDFELEREKKKLTIRIFFDLLLHIWAIAVLAYIFRNLLHLIPWPFEGVYGYKHLKVKEIATSALFMTITIIFDSYFHSQFALFKERLGIPMEYYLVNHANTTKPVFA